jgi:uncharacterized Fe-S cluster protein YjdI
MTIIYHANKVQEVSTTTGTGNFVLSGATTGFKTFASTIGANNRFTYYIYRQDTNFEWEVGIGYITISGGVTQLIRERIVSSTNNDNAVGFTSGTKYIESIVGETSVNTSFINVEEKSSNFSAPYNPATYIIDASVTGVQVTLPGITSQVDPIIMGFLLDKTIGNVYEQANAITLIPSGSETIDGQSSKTISILKDYLQIVSIPSQTGWLLLDPIQDATNPYGNDGNIQFKYNSAFSGVNDLSWENTNKSLLIGGTGNLVSADVIIPASGQTIVFNEQSLDKDFRVEGSGTTHLFFIDGSTNRIGIDNSNPLDKIDINSNNNQGLTIYKSGIGPQLTLSNTSVSGAATNDIIGAILFSGLNDNNAPVSYGKIYSLVEDATNGSELSSLNFEIVNNGSNEDVAIFSSSGISLGFNNQNIDGIIIGNASDNEGNNVCLGYYNSACATNSVLIGNSSSIASGTFGGAIGYDHSVSGSNIWVIGGSGVSATGTNRVYIALNNNNHLSILNSGTLAYTTLTNQDTTFNLTNSAILSSGLKEQISFNFVNSSGTSRSGVVVGMDIITPTNGSEKTQFFVNVLNTSSGLRVLSLDKDSLITGYNSYSGNNIIYGIGNTIVNSGNRILGSNIIGTGINNNIFGNSISYSGNNISIFGNSNICENSGNLGITIFGNTNIVNEDYSTIIGTNNSSSGLYAVACGYLNGVHGDYSVAVGEGNLVLSDGSIVIGNTNSVSGTSLDATIFAMGIGNTAIISSTGYLLGHSNEMYGSGGLLIGNNSYTSGHNNLVIGNNISFTGTNTVFFANSGTVQISGSTGSIIHNGILTAPNNQISVTSTGTYITGSGSNGNLNISYGSLNNATFTSSGISISGSPAKLINNNNTVMVSSTGAYLINGNHYVEVDSTGVDIFSPSIVNIKATGAGSPSILIESSGTTIRSNTDTKIIVDDKISLNNVNNNINIYYTGIGMVASGDVDYLMTTSGTNFTFYGPDDIYYSTYGYNVPTCVINNSGLYINDIDILGTTYPISSFELNKIRFFNNPNALPTSFTNSLLLSLESGYVRVNGPTQFGNLGTPSATVDISGDLRINATGNGITYENYPTSTGIASVLVIEDNIIKLAGSGIEYSTYSQSTGCGVPLVIEDNTIKTSKCYTGCCVLVTGAALTSGILTSDSERIQLIDPNTSTYSLTLTTGNFVGGREFFIRNTSPMPTGEKIDIIDEYSASTICTLGGTGIQGSGDLSCHVVFDSTQWHVVMISK